MRCPKCGAEGRVVTTLEYVDGIPLHKRTKRKQLDIPAEDFILRRLKCIGVDHHRFETVEVVKVKFI